MEKTEEFMQRLIDEALSGRYDQDSFTRLKMRLCKEYRLSRMPTNIEILLHAPEKRYNELSFLMTKPTRTLSGVAVVAVMTEPHACPHGRCAVCPGGPGSVFGSVPQSYTGIEPATRRGIRNRFDPYQQVFNRLEHYIVTGHMPEKIELIVMGGTFMSLDKRYKERFIRDCFKAMNDFSRMFFRKGELQFDAFRRFFELPADIDDERRARRVHRKVAAQKKAGTSDQKTIEAQQKRNESSRVRCVSLVLETRPDHATSAYADEMLKLGCTKVELGVQSTYERALSGIERGHTVKDSIEASRILRERGFKLTYHMMPGLPGISLQEDVETFRTIFGDERFRPDMLKIYPCMVLEGTRLYDMWRRGQYTPMDAEQAKTLLKRVKEMVPPYVRIMRVQRDIPTQAIEAGVRMTNLRQKVLEQMREEGVSCGCIRCREIGRQDSVRGEVKLYTYTYTASQGTEIFISAESDNALVGFSRLRIPAGHARREITADSALLRELHVFGQAAGRGKQGPGQHRGWGGALLGKAEEVARQWQRYKVVVISGVGVRGYYRRFGYRRQGPYMVKRLKR